MESIKKRILAGLVIGTFILLPGMKGKASINKDNSLKTNISSNMEYSKIDRIGVTTKEVNLRVGPSIDNDKIGTIKKGELLEISYLNNNGWYLVNYNDTLGFIKSEYAKVIDFDKIEKEVNNLPIFYDMAMALDNINLRSNPDKESQKIGEINKKEKMLILKRFDNGFVEVVTENKIGYIDSRYIKEKKVCKSPSYKQVYITKGACIYSYPYSTVIDYLSEFETVFVYGEVDDFYYIEKDGVVGFVRKMDTKDLTGKYVIVDISSQMMYLYDNNNLIMKSKVVTGKPSTPTYLGDYSIKEHTPNKILKGYDEEKGEYYESFVKYWMPFNEGEGLHDASWRDKFGGNIYINKGSHGCVNLPTKVAKKLYNEVSVGTKVLVKE